MSCFVLLLLLFLCSCREDAGVPPVLLDQVARAPVLACTERDALGMPGSATELSTLGDTAVVALFGDARTIVLLDDSLRMLRRAELPADGPDGIADPVSVAADGDSLLVADARGQKIDVFDWNGSRRRYVHTDFAPLQLVRSGDRIAVAPAVIGRFPGTLLFYVRDSTVQRARIDVVEFADLTTKALGNRVKLLPVPDGLVILHQFFTPRAWYLAGDHVLPLRVPLARGLAGTIGYVPPLPLNDAALAPALVVANDGARAGDDQLLLLVRTGRRNADRFEKALMRTDSRLRFIASHRLPVSPGLMSYLPRTRTAVLVDEEDRWYTCPLP